MNPLLLALQHGDSAFPSGGFAFSQGLEGWTSESGRPDAGALGNFMAQQVRRRWAISDRLALLRAHEAADTESIAEIDRAFDRTQVVATFAEGSRRNGRALLSSHRRLGTDGAEALHETISAGRMDGHLPVVQGAMWRALGLDAESAAAASGYAFAAGMVTAAVRLNLIGAITGQRLLADLLREVSGVLAQPPSPDAEFASFTPFAEIAAMRGATGDSRLFSN